jgi:uncharacterized membrane protein YhhN
MSLKYSLLTVIIFISLVHLNAVKNKNVKLAYITKPILMPSILMYYLSNTAKVNPFIIIALFFSFLGDIFLIFKNKSLLMGICSFAIAHLCYIIIFVFSVMGENINFKISLLFAPYLGYIIFLYHKLLHQRNGGKAPFIAYMLVISVMSFTALLRGLAFSRTDYWWTYMGSLLFMISDSFIAFELLKPGGKKREVLVMLTYISAQLLIISGFM